MSKQSMMSQATITLLTCVLSCSMCASVAVAAEQKHVVIVAGLKSHGPEGNGIHDYAWSARLLRAMLETSNVKNEASRIDSLERLASRRGSIRRRRYRHGHFRWPRWRHRSRSTAPREHGSNRASRWLTKTRRRLHYVSFLYIRIR